MSIKLEHSPFLDEATKQTICDIKRRFDRDMADYRYSTRLQDLYSIAQGLNVLPYKHRQAIAEGLELLLNKPDYCLKNLAGRPVVEIFLGCCLFGAVHGNKELAKLFLDNITSSIGANAPDFELP